MMKKAIYFILSSILLISCEDVIELDLPESDPIPVVEGRITDQVETKFVNLNYSVAYNSSDPNPPISNARILLFENGIKVDSLVESNSVEGTYEFTHVGQVGSIYHLEIELPNGRELASIPEPMVRIPEIDSVYSEYLTDNPFLQNGYYVAHALTDPAGLGDYYQWKYAFNDSIEEGPFSLNLGDDRFVDGNAVNDILVNFDPLELGDTVHIEQYTMTKTAYDYWNLVSTQTQQVGSIFDPPPAPVIGNVRDSEDGGKTILGYFMATGKRTASIVIED